MPRGHLKTNVDLLQEPRIRNKSASVLRAQSSNCLNRLNAPAPSRHLAVVSRCRIRHASVLRAPLPPLSLADEVVDGLPLCQLIVSSVETRPPQPNWLRLNTTCHAWRTNEKGRSMTGPLALSNQLNLLPASRDYGPESPCQCP